MKTHFLTSIAIAIGATAAIILSVACSNEEKSLTTSSKNLAMIERAKEFGQMHNVRVAEALANLEATPSRAGGRSMVDIRAQVSNFLAAKAKTSRGDGLPPMPGGGFGAGDDSLFIDGGKTIPSIRDEMDELERDIIDRGLLAVDQGKIKTELNNLLLETADSDLPDLHKQAVMNFLTTLQASELYWQETNQDWVAFLRANLSDEDLEIFKLNENSPLSSAVVFADAYYAWWGTCGSGGNLLIGAACAATGSIFAYLNTK